jgi:hypothetical protein
LPAWLAGYRISSMKALLTIKTLKWESFGTVDVCESFCGENWRLYFIGFCELLKALYFMYLGVADLLN